MILLAVGWYLRFSLSYRDVEELLAERGLLVDPSPSGGGFNAPGIESASGANDNLEKLWHSVALRSPSNAMTQKICTCYIEPVTTVGHVPPKCFFSKPLPADL